MSNYGQVFVCNWNAISVSF